MYFVSWRLVLFFECTLKAIDILFWIIALLFCLKVFFRTGRSGALVTSIPGRLWNVFLISFRLLGCYRLVSIVWGLRQITNCFKKTHQSHDFFKISTKQLVSPSVKDILLPINLLKWIVCIKNAIASPTLQIELNLMFFFLECAVFHSSCNLN